MFKEILTLNDTLGKDKIYSVYFKSKGEDGYETWKSDWSGKVVSTKEQILNKELLSAIINANGWDSYKFYKVEFKDVTDICNEIKSLELEEENFDWNTKEFEEWEIINDKINELNGKTFPNYFCTIKIDKTI